MKRKTTRELFFENLEDRLYFCVPADVLAIIGIINNNEGAGAVVANNDQLKELDVNGDGMIAPIDALAVINEINRADLVDERPGVSHPSPKGVSSIYFSLCGSNMDLILLATRAVDSTAVAVKIGDEVFKPVVIGTFGQYERWEFEVYGQGLEWLRIIGDFPDDDLLTLIKG